MEQKLTIIYYSAAEDFRSKQYPDPKYCIRFYYLNKERMKRKKSVDFALPAKHLAHMTGHDLSVQIHALINHDNRRCQAVMFDIYSTCLVSWIWPILLSNIVSSPEHTFISGNCFLQHHPPTLSFLSLLPQVLSPVFDIGCWVMGKFFCLFVLWGIFFGGCWGFWFCLFVLFHCLYRLLTKAFAFVLNSRFWFYSHWRCYTDKGSSWPNIVKWTLRELMTF